MEQQEGGLYAFATAAATKLKAEREARGQPPFPLEQAYRGLRARGRNWGAEIQDRESGVQVWLGTYDTREEAACAYDAVVRTQLSTYHRKSNLPDPGWAAWRNAAVDAHFAEARKAKRERQARKAGVASIAVEAPVANEAAVFSTASPPPPVPAPPLRAIYAPASRIIGPSRMAPAAATVVVSTELSLAPPAPAPAPALAGNSSWQSISQSPPILSIVPLAFRYPNSNGPP